jgi:transcriptional regulator with XRE-family HTH domain
VKKKPRLGQLIKASRQSAGFSQRELGRSVGVTASHIAYIESGTRHPSRSVVLRLAQILRIDRQELIRAAYPELAPSIAPTNGNHKQAWRGFVAVARQHSVTPREMTVMRQISLIGKISSSSSYLFILNTIRQSLEAD